MKPKKQKPYLPIHIKDDDTDISLMIFEKSSEPFWYWVKRKLKNVVKNRRLKISLSHRTDFKRLECGM